MTRVLGTFLVAAAVLVIAFVGAALSGADAERESAIIFDHQSHHEFGVECDQCHATAVVSESGDTNDLPTMDACSDCHDVEDEAGCGMCHVDPSDPQAAARIRKTLGFSHKLHLEEAGDCFSCHPGIANANAPSLPGHDECFSCHDGTIADNTCSVCHEGEMKKPADHGVAFGHTHRYAADVSAGRCETCHASSDMCSECHAGENIIPQTHERDFLFTHPLDLQGRMYECTSCHDIESFCAECHMDLGVVPPEHRTADWVTGSNLHGLRAQQNIEACAACHQQGEPGRCSTCHSDLDGIKGSDTDIHPVGFGGVSGHGPWHDDPGYYCLECHADTRAHPEQDVGFCIYCHEPR